MADQGNTEPPAPGKGKHPAPRSRTELTYFARLLLDGANSTHGRLLLMGASLWFIGGVLTFGSWLTRDEQGHYHVWVTFFAVGGACFLFGALAWIWKALRKDRAP